MKILHVTESRGWSGGTVQLWSLCQALEAGGHKVALFCPPDGELAKRAQAAGMDLTACPLRQDYDLRAARRLAETVRRFQPDVVHAHHPRAHALSLLAGFSSPFPCLIVSRRVSFPLKKWNLFSQWKYRTSRIRAIVAVSEDIRRVMVEGGVPPGRVCVIHSGVDTKKFSARPPSEETRASLGLPVGAPVVGNLTHYSWWKGQSFFLEAAKRVTDSEPSAHFLLAGKDTDGAEAKAKVRDLGIEKRVTLAGFRTDVPEILSFLSVSVVSSLAGEGFSGVLRESMSMGVPVVATDVGGNRELVVNEETGLLVPPADARALAEAIRRLLTDKALASACAQAAQRQVLSRYSIDNMVKETLALYEKLGGSHGSHA